MRNHIKEPLDRVKARSTFALQQASKHSDEMLIIVKALHDAIAGQSESIMVLESHLGDVEKQLR